MARLSGTGLAIALLQTISAIHPAAAFAPPCALRGSAPTVGIPNKGSTACWRQGLARSAARRGAPPLMSEGGGGSIKVVGRVQLQDMDREAIRALGDGEPRIISNVWGEGGTERDEAWSEGMMERLAETDVQFQIRNSITGVTELREGSLDEFMEGCFESSPAASWLLFDEELLREEPSLTREILVPEEVFGRDLFAEFPAALRPADACLIMGGAGGRSMLHADPWEWIGYNYLLEGSKIWAFADPASAGGVDSIISAYRLESNAWDGASFNVSAGWQSDLDLWKTFGGDVMSARELGSLPEPERAAGLAAALKSAQEHLEKHSSLPLGALRLALQREGDLIIIPPRWWHQTFHLEPSLAVASQYTSEENLPRVLSHMTNWCGADATSPGSPDTTATVPDTTASLSDTSEDAAAHPAFRREIDAAILQALTARHGREKAVSMLSDMRAL